MSFIGIGVSYSIARTKDDCFLETKFWSSFSIIIVFSFRDWLILEDLIKVFSSHMAFEGPSRTLSNGPPFEDPLGAVSRITF